MDLLQVKSVREAIDICLDCMHKLSFKRIKEVETIHALNYVLAEDIVAGEDIPSFRRSLMDGFALVSRSTTGASETIPTILRIVETVEMGHVPQEKISPDTASQIFTGGMLPEGADAVLPIEYADKITAEILAVYQPLRPLDHVVEVGDDCKKGDLYFKAGTRIGPETIAGCISLGLTKVKVYEKLRARILSTGDEILPPDAEIPPGKTRDVNSYSVDALCQALGIEVLERLHVADDKQAIRDILLQDDVDLLIISGSSSKGDKDYVPLLVDELFDPGLLVHGIAIKPGKPTSLSSDGKKLVLGLPGHPVSAMAVFEVFFAQAWKEFYQVDPDLAYPARVSRNVAAAPGRTQIQFVKVFRQGQDLIAEPIFGASGNLSTLAKSDGYFIIDYKEEGVEQGDLVWVNLL